MQANSAVTAPQNVMNIAEKEMIYQWVLDIPNPETREKALLELSKKRETVSDLAPMLWHTFGTVAALLQEIINIYPSISPASLTAYQSNRVCNALALLQCLASHPETRSAFLQANIPLFLYPFLHTTSKSRPFEYLRLTSLGVIGALVKTDEQEVITFLLTTEIIPLCLRIMESGTDLSKTVATFILQKILLDDSGLNYICQTYDRFSHVAMILGKMVLGLAKEQSARLLKHVVRCYFRLSDNARAREALRQCLPDQLKDNTFSSCLAEDNATKHFLVQLLKNLEPPTGNSSTMASLVRSQSIRFLSAMRNTNLAEKIISRGYADQMSFTFVAANHTFYANQSVKQVDVPSLNGAFGILPNHVPVLAVLKPGVVIVTEDDGAVKKVLVSSGTVTVNDDSSVQILAEEAHPLENFDLQAANEALREAEQKFSSASSEKDKAEAQIALEAGQAIVAAISAH
ncbi:hypothetical protein V9T40_007053 [Parthenolecanium corni]|uniref:CCR4-NOT transcription complex subunit 9 n=1 Tax=Parthenolecanium corni TaxID=536013 RepID=A0AAN9YBS2_9HEMI